MFPEQFRYDKNNEMTIPNALLENTSILQRLLVELPESFSLDYMEEDGITFTVINAAWSTNDQVSAMISDGMLRINSSVSYIDQEFINLTDYTLNQLIAYFRGKYGTTNLLVSLPSGYSYEKGEYLASTLIEGSANFSNTPFTWSRFTSPNYAFMGALALGLVIGKNDVFAALQELDIRVANGKWIDLWGHLLGFDRIASEIGDDISYRNRVQREAVYAKSNNIAISALISESIDRESRVIDGGIPFLLRDTAVKLPYVGNASGTGSLSENTLTIASSPTPSGSFGINQTLYNIPVAGTSIVSDTHITARVNGTGGSGTYTIDISYPSPLSSVSLGSRITGISLTAADESYRLGPDTGAGTFLVYVKLADGETELDQSLTSLLYVLINNWKPAGLQFSIKSY